MRDNLEFLRLTQYSMMAILFIMIFLILLFSMKVALGFYMIFVMINIAIHIIFKSKMKGIKIILSSLMGPILTITHIYFYIKLKKT
jgi:hypothetical protein